MYVDLIAVCFGGGKSLGRMDSVFSFDHNFHPINQLTAEINVWVSVPLEIKFPSFKKFVSDSVI